jgi:hydroxymethylbilane synthase
MWLQERWREGCCEQQNGLRWVLLRQLPFQQLQFLPLRPLKVSNRVLRIGTRGSMLALTQSEWVKGEIERHWPGCRIELQVIKTTGDKILDVPLAKVGGKGLFVKELEDALLDGSADLAVHSMKDVPAILPEGLEIGAIPTREDPRDVLISRNGEDLSGLRLRARLGTSSLRRAAQIKNLRSDLEIENLRGNLDTRLRKLQEGRYDAIVLAAAGLHRMGWKERITAYLDPTLFLPAIGQGALGIEIRSGDGEIRQLLEPLRDPVTTVAVQSERSLLKTLEGGCQVPIAGHARVLDGCKVELSGLVASIDGKQIFRRTRSAPLEEAESLGRSLAVGLLEDGARAVLEEIYRSGGT